MSANQGILIQKLNRKKYLILGQDISNYSLKYAARVYPVLDIDLTINYSGLLPQNNYFWIFIQTGI